MPVPDRGARLHVLGQPPQHGRESAGRGDQEELGTRQEKPELSRSLRVIAYSLTTEQRTSNE